jgi:hypothetical protein
MVEFCDKEYNQGAKDAENRAEAETAGPAKDMAATP